MSSGHRIAFSSSRDRANNIELEIYVMDADGSSQIRLTHNPGLDQQPVWSPAGSCIAFISGNGGTNNGIYVMNDDGSGFERLTNSMESGFNDIDPSWSPDGKHIAFSSNRDRNYEVYVMNADGSHQMRLTNSPGYDEAPAWSPTGRASPSPRIATATMRYTS